MDNLPQLLCVACDRPTNGPEVLGLWALLFCSHECAAATVADLGLEEYLGVRYDEPSGAFPYFTSHDKVCGGCAIQWLATHPNDSDPIKRAWLTVVRFWGSPLVLRLRFDPNNDQLRTTLHGIELDTSPRAFQRARQCANLLLLQSRRGRPTGSTKFSEQEFRFCAETAWAWLRKSAKDNGDRPRLKDLARELKLSPNTLTSNLKRWDVDLSDFDPSDFDLDDLDLDDLEDET